MMGDVIRLLHTADWQVGMVAAHAGEAADLVRQRRLDSARRVLEVARERDVDLLLVAGDTFEHNGVQRVLIQQVADILGQAGRPVYIIPGNHDPLVPGSVWDHPAWESHPDVHVVRGVEPVKFEGGTLFACPVAEAHSTADPTAWIRAGEGGEGIRIAMAHGTFLSLPLESPDHPIPPDAARRAGLDYLALGHWHSTSMFQDEDGVVRTAYPGTHEPTSFGERDSGNVLVVQIEKPGAHPKLEKVPTARLRWMDMQRHVEGPADLDALVADVEALEDPGDVLLRVILSGHVTPEGARRLGHLSDVVDARFLHGRIEDSSLGTAPDDDVWISQLPAGTIRETAARLHQMASAGDQGSKVAVRALLELYQIVSEVES